jgi:DNA mismatch repair protein MutL
MSAPVIRALSESTIHQIAAGEVIERPANVVKELVENALDAGATRITISCEEGGKELIRVADNGKGMVPEDVRRCWLPHTTSKIRDMDDLEAVATMGFRGEALCSMAAVSELTLETRNASLEVGHSLTIREGREDELRECARSLGTTVTVRHLFLNNPVRRKFLGSGRSEATRILNQVTKLALARPDVAFRLLEGQKEVLHFREGSMKHRIGEVVGFHQVESLLPVHWTDGTIRVEGMVSTPQEARQRSNHQHFFVNARAVFSPVLQRALANSYDVLPPGHHPVAVLFITLPPREVDVNIHPTKREIRFLHESRLHWAIGQAVTQALRLHVGAPTLELEAPVVSASADLALAPVFHFDPSASSGSAVLTDSAGSLVPALDEVVRETGRLLEFPGHATASVSANPNQPQLLPQPAEVVASPYLQVHHRFIVFAVSGGMMVVNQQAAHERVLYEKALEDLRRPGRFTSQQLLFPEVVELSPEEAQLADAHLAGLQALGFDLEGFGGRTFQVRGLPSEVEIDQAKRILRDLLQDLRDSDSSRPKAGEEVALKLARAFAKVTCIRLGEPLDSPRMAGLMDALFATRNPYVSPTGAPVVIRFPLGELHRRFGIKEPE